MSNEDGENDVQAREKVAELPQSDRVDTPPVLSMDTPLGQGRDTPHGQDGQGRDTPLSGKTRIRWKEAYREVFGKVDNLLAGEEVDQDSLDALAATLKARMVA